MKMPPYQRLLFFYCAAAISGCETAYPVVKKRPLVTHQDVPASLAAPISGGCKPAAIPAAVKNVELDYIAARRRHSGLSGKVPQLGYALSGGGIRSATINLGFLRSLAREGILPQVDYLTSVSGGGYIGGWYVSHLRTPAELAAMKQELLATGKSESEVASILAEFASDPRDLLGLDAAGHSPRSQAFFSVQTYGGIAGKGSERVFNTTKALGKFVATWPLNLVVDGVLHLKPNPGKFNSFHPIYRYRAGLENYYMAGWKEFDTPGRRPFLESDINGAGSKTPYFLACGAMLNSSPGEYTDGKCDPDGVLTSHHFEFGSRWTGSPGLGWIRTPDFDKCVHRVTEDKDTGRVSSVRLLEGPLPGMKTKPFPVITAMAASGAAVDAGTLAVDHPSINAALDVTLSALNLNLRYETSNPTQSLTAPHERVFDRLRETTKERFLRSPRSNTLTISDGGHFENLAIYGQLRRRVPLVVAMDAGMDGSYTFSDLNNLLTLIRQRGWKATVEDGGDFTWAPNKQTPQTVSLPKEKHDAWLADPVAILKVSDDSGLISRIVYVKSSRQNIAGYYPPVLDQAGRVTLMPAELQRKVDAVSQKDSFPHIFTFSLMGWGPERFNAYCAVGDALGAKAVAKVRKYLK